MGFDQYHQPADELSAEAVRAVEGRRPRAAAQDSTAHFAQQVGACADAIADACSDA